MKNIKDIPIFFIVGRERSGTSLLRSIFDAHENVSIPLECRFIIDLYKKFHNKRIWTKGDLLEFYKNVAEQPAFNLYSIDYAELKNNLLMMEGENDYSTVCKVVYFTYRSWNPKKEILLLGDKNPSYSLHLKTLIKLFPGAKFIHIIRDYRDNIHSMCKVNFESHNISSLAYRWKHYNMLIDKSKALHPELFYTLRYEDLVEDPAFFMSQICDFTGIEFKPEMLEFYRSRDKVMSIYPERLVDTNQKSLFNPINRSSVNSWKKNLSPHKIKMAESVCGDYGNKYDYKKKYKKSDLYINLISFPGKIYGRAYFIWIKMLNMLPYRIKIKIFHTLAKIFRHYWKSYKRVGTNYDGTKN